ncbi:MAG: dephospho-CoA kinase [Peptococcaceae bacterium]|nr:dephospho-CoA kinase [Peptococcaceae bacterium]
MIIGITGGIASGKTAVSDYVKKLGYPVIDADELSREIMEPGSSVLDEVRMTFGEAVFQADGSLNRQALGRFVFSDREARQKLDAITHPAIARLAQKRFSEHQHDALVFFVVPLLYESGMDRYCDTVWLVHVDDTLREKRLMARDKIDVTYARQKMASQMTEIERLAHRPEVIRNDGDLEQLHKQVRVLIKKLQKS